MMVRQPAQEFRLRVSGSEIRTGGFKAASPKLPRKETLNSRPPGAISRQRFDAGAPEFHALTPANSAFH